MAQIVTITNPLTGQPEQVDQLEHTAQQIDDGIGFESTDYPGCYYRLVNGVVEWFNPPMLLGVEYRTTERYLWKPVYAKLVDCGALPNSTIKIISHGEQVLNAISCTLELTSASGNHATTPEINSDNTVSVFAQLSQYNIIIMANRDFSTYTAVSKIKYTKTTD